jgi:hypothetical protein
MMPCATVLCMLYPMMAGPLPPCVPARIGADTTTAKELRAIPLETGQRIRLDGILSEPFWESAPPAVEFVQQEPHEGMPATERTRVHVVFDDENLYIGALLHDSDPAGVLGRQLQRDAGLGSDDRFMWILDTFLDGRTGYFFEINPAGLMGDGLLRASPGGSQVNKSWDGIWEARVARGDWGWSAEIRIPFRTLNFDPNSDAWGINFQRTVRRRNEESLWSGHMRTAGLLNPVHAGRLTGIRNVSQGIGLEVKPYVVSTWQKAPLLDRPAAETAGDVGLDVTYSITPSLRASLTINTDFAETEVDQRRVNLTRFPLVFPERRDFFLEGSGVYAFAASSGPNPYFSRRIGLVGGQPVPIRWGVRMGGQAGSWDLGFQQIRTGDHDLGTGEDFTVARARRNIFRQSTVGAIYTRRATPATVTAGSLLGNTVGFDLDLFTSRFRGNRNLQFEAFLVWHDDAAGNPATTFGDRTARGLRLNYPNDVIQAHVSFREFGNEYSPYVGFVSRRGFRRTQPTVRWRPRPGGTLIRRLQFVTEVEHLTDLRGRLQTFGVDVTPFGIELESGDAADVVVRRDFERLDSGFEIHPSILIPAGDYTFHTWQAQVRTATRRRVSANASVGGGGFWDGRRFQSSLGLAVRPRPGLGLDASWERNDVQLEGGDFEANVLRTGAGWQLNPWVSLNGNVQYDDVSREVGVFTRFRWILRPGSDLYLVYTHNLRERIGLPESPRDTGFETLERRAALKLNYTYRF